MGQSELVRPRRKRRLKTDSLLFGALAALVFVLPLPLGSNRTWFWLFEAAFVWFLVGGVMALLGTKRLQLSPAVRAARPALLAAACWIGFGVFQLVSWPGGFPGRPGATITVEVGASTLTLLQTLFYLGLFFLTLQLVNTLDRMRWLMGAIVWAAMFQAAYGSLMTLSGAEYGFLAPKEYGVGLATGTFVNRNHFAGYLELGLAIGLGSLVAQLGRRRPGSSRAQLRDWVALLLGPKFRLRLFLVVMVIGLVLSHSRMGNTAFFASMLVTGILALLLMKRPPRSLVILLASLVIIDVLVIGTWFGVEQVVERIQETGTFDEASGRYRDEDRLDVDAETLSAWADYRWFGSGGGTFYTVFPSHRPMDLGSFFDHAHNDYLELLLEYGIIGSLPLLAFTLFCGAAGVAGLRRRHGIVRGVGFASTMAFVAYAIHSTVDFNLHIPANAGTLMVVLALPWAAGSLHRRRTRTKE